MSLEVSDANPLKFVAFSSLVNTEFWAELAGRKLDTYRLNDEAQPICGFYGPGHQARTSCRLTLLRDSFATADPSNSGGGGGPGARFQECRAIGVIKNVNTSEAFRALDKAEALKDVVHRVWQDVVTGRAIVQPELLLRFFLLTFADLKKSTFVYWFAFPTLGSQNNFGLTADPVHISSIMTSQDLSSLTTGLSLLWGRTVDEATGAIQGCPPFFVIVRTVGSPCKTEVEGRLKDKGGVRVLSLAEYEETKIVADTLQGDKRCYELGDVGDWDTPEGVMFGFFDPSAEPGIPGWPLRNLLVLISVRWGVRKAKVLCYRGLVPRPRQEVGLPAAAAFQDTAGGADESIVLNVWLGPEQIKSVGTAFHEEIPAEVEAAWLHPGVGKLGWEPNLKGRLGPRGADLSSVMDPLRLAKSSVRLNIKLMRWSAIPELDVDMLESTKCLLLGAGTLGCAVARTLLGWGVEHITLVDNGRVSYSNPVRQSLYTHQDCLNEGAHKAEAAAAALAAVYPGVRSKGYVLTIPMPGHPPATDQEADEFRRHAEELEALVRSHDVVFVLTDSRESRWLPTLLTAELDKPCMNVALGLDSFLVVRHGGMLGSEGGGGGVDTPVAPSKAEANEDVGAVTKGVARGTGGGGLMSGSSGLGGGAGPSGGAPQQLGCYFCTDVVAPENSMLNRTLDQQCTVTRPGLAPMAAAAAVELVVGLLHHPLRHRAPPDNCAGGARDIGAAQAAAAMGQSRALGALPHQVRFFINNFSTVTPSALAFDQCTACSSAVVNAHIQGGWSFIRRVCTCPRLLEEISGLDELHRATEGIDVDLDWDEEDEDHLMSVA